MTKFAAIPLLFLMLTACDDGGTDDAGGGEDAGAPGFPLVGVFTDSFGTEHIISEEEWVQTNMGAASGFQILSIDEDLRQVLAQNDPTNPFSPSLFSRFDWLVRGQDLFYCQAAFDKASQAEAAAVSPSDDRTPDTSGCGDAGFPWTRLLPGE